MITATAPTTPTGIDVRDIVLSNNTFGPREITALMQTIAEDYQQFSVLRDAVGELEAREDRSPAAAVRLGVCQFVLGRYRQSIETLRSADGGALAHFYIGKSQFSSVIMAKRSSRTQPQRRPATTAMIVRWPRPKRIATARI